MIALAVLLLTCAWLWSTGAEVPARPDMAGALWSAGTLVLFCGYVAAGRRLPLGRRLGRGAAWAALTGLLCGACAFAAGPILDWGGPFLSYLTAPASLLAAAARLAGLDAIARPGLVVVQDLSSVPAHATSWEQMNLSASIVLVVLIALATQCRARGWLRGVAAAAIGALVWMPVRFLLATRLVEDLGWLGVHWHPVAVAASLAPAAWLATRVSPLRSVARLPLPVTWRGAGLLIAGAAGVAALTYGLTTQPRGRPAEGRILIDDAHSDWEWSGIPFDRETYGRQTTYSYYCLLDFLAHHYSEVTANVDDDLTDDLLAGADILILKTPTRPYLLSERDAIVRFVERGGGLLLISDHTNLFGMTTYINPIGEPFGIEFLTDDTFDLTSGRASTFAPPRLAAHAAVAHLPEMEFETSCSLRPAPGLRPIMSGRGLGSEPVDYSHINFFGNISPDPNERWGILLQAASATRGRGRVIAFTDSTVWSNFSTFFAAKPELALGFMEFLNRRPDRWQPLRGAIPAAGLLLVALALRPALRRSPAGRRARPGRRRKGSRTPGWVTGGVLAMAAGIAGGGILATRANTAAYRLPGPRSPMEVVAFDRQHSDFRLPTLLEPTVADPQRCFDTFFVTTQRIHLFPRVAESLTDATSGSRVVVVLNAAASPSEEELAALYRWVRAGGRLLVMEPATGAHLAANRFLEPSRMRISAAFSGQGGVPSAAGLAIYGGRAEHSAPDAEAPLVSIAEVGSGRVVAVLGSERFSFQSMGPAFNDPTPAQRAAYNRVYDLFDRLVLPEGWVKKCPLVRRHTKG